MHSIRVFFVGGLLSFRALFGWLNPWIYVPSLLIAPLFQILLFAAIGRSAHVASNEFYLIGNALQYVAVPCLFAMSSTIGSERYTQTLGIVLTTPARRVPLFLGRAVPVLLNGCVVALFSLSVGGLLLGVHIPRTAWLGVLLTVLVAAASCTGLGMINAAIGLRVRETSVMSNIIFGTLLIFCGANVPARSLPHWMNVVGNCLPLTHSIRAARSIAAGRSVGSAANQLLIELAIGAVSFTIGLAALAWLERSSRRNASLERQ